MSVPDREQDLQTFEAELALFDADAAFTMDALVAVQRAEDERKKAEITGYLTNAAQYFTHFELNYSTPSENGWQSFHTVKLGDGTMSLLVAQAGSGRRATHRAIYNYESRDTIAGTKELLSYEYCFDLPSRRFNSRRGIVQIPDRAPWTIETYVGVAKLEHSETGLTLIHNSLGYFGPQLRPNDSDDLTAAAFALGVLDDTVKCMQSGLHHVPGITTQFPRQ